MNAVRAVRRFFALRTATMAEEKARALRTDIDARVAKMEALPRGDHRGWMAAEIYLDLDAVHDAEQTARKARARADAFASNIRGLLPWS